MVDRFARDTEGLGPDGSVWLRCYLELADSLWFSACCRRCGHAAPIGVRAAIQMAGDVTARELARRLRCAECGTKGVLLMVTPDTRTPEARRRDGPAPETRAGLVGRGG
jgi:hypothetical protein